jgi:hypothetical protein
VVLPGRVALYGTIQFSTEANEENKERQRRVLIFGADIVENEMVQFAVDRQNEGPPPTKSVVFVSFCPHFPVLLELVRSELEENRAGIPMSLPRS